jgi:hypothetical protein
MFDNLEWEENTAMQKKMMLTLMIGMGLLLLVLLFPRWTWDCYSDGGCIVYPHSSGYFFRWYPPAKDAELDTNAQMLTLMLMAGILAGAFGVIEIRKRKRTTQYWRERFRNTT